MEYQDSDIDLFFKRKNLIYLISILAIINLFLFFIKFLPTLWQKSIALQSDSVNSLADFGYSLIVLVGVYYSYRPSDETHPHGHERIKPFIALIIAISIILTAIFVIKEALDSLFGQQIVSYSNLFLVVLTISIIIKTVLYKYFRDKAKQKNDELLKSIAGDNKVDVLASISALIGVIGIYLGYPILDIAFGLIISILIFKTGLDIFKRNIGYLVGSAPDEEVKNQIIKIVEKRSLGSFEVECHHVGPKLHVYAKISVSPELGIKEAHELEEKIKKEIESIREVEIAYIHLYLEPKEGKND